MKNNYPDVFRWLYAILLLIFSSAAFAQTPTTSDCLGARPICASSYFQNSGYTGGGNYVDLPTGGAGCPANCLTTGENNSVWYTFTPSTSGNFSFTITPTNPSDNLNWAVYNITNGGCASILNNPNAQISCNACSSTGSTGPNGVGFTNCEGTTGCIPYNLTVPVTAGNNYVFVVDNPTSAPGYNIVFTGTTAQIYDNVAPLIQAVSTPVNCGTTTLNLTFNENILNTSVSGADFTLTGPGGPYTVTNAQCMGGSAMSTTLTLTVTPAVSTLGSYTLCLVTSSGSVTDVCANQAPAGCVNFNLTPPTIVVTPSSTTICEGETDTLVATGATTWSWSPTAGLSNPFVANPVVSPSSTTTYTVTGSLGICSATATAVVNVNPAPTLTINATPPTICAGGQSNLTVSGANSYVWSDNLGTSATVTVTPPNTYAYSVTGTNSLGCQGTESIIITVYPAPNVSAMASPNPVCAGSQTTLTGNGALSYTWSNGIGAGNPVTANPTTPTTYTVTATDTNSCTATASVFVDTYALPTATVSGGGTICTNDTAMISIALTGVAPWDFTVSNGTSSFTFTGIGATPFVIPVVAAGTYSVTSVSDIHCTGTGTGSAQVTLLPLPNVVLQAFADACEGGAPFMLTGGGPAGGTYSGNGVSGGMFDPTAAGVGIHPITYFYTDGNNCSNTATQNITVWPSPNVSLSALPDVCPGDAPFLLAGGNPYGGSYIGTGVSNNIFNPSIAGPGTHTITYTYTDPNNCTNTATNTINVLQAPVVTFPSPGSVCASAAPFNLTGGSPAGGSYYGPGVVNGIFSPAMAGPGNHIVVYSYIDPVTGCSDTAQAHISVFSLPVVTLTPYNAYCLSSPAFALSGGNPSGGIYSGTGVSANMFNPAVAGLGTHTINYTYVDPLTSCTNTASTSLVVNSGIQISVTPDNVTICSGSYASLTALGAQSYTWSPASSLSASTGAAVIANPTATTQYTVVGTNADGCTGSAVTTVDIHPMANLDFTPDPAAGCAPLTVDFEFNANMAVVQNNSWLWNFNDPGYPGNTSTLQEPSHTFQNAGIYNVLLTISTIHGCQESFVTPVTVHPKPIAAFSTQPDVAYINHPEFQFIDESVYGSYWYWDFGDPSSMLHNYSDIQNPVHMYSDTGTYEVMLVVESQHHCSDTAINEVYIFPESLFYIPNAFTPDEDGLNDYFKPEFNAIMENMYEFYIYDRWGRLVFETKDINQAWDGRLKSGEFGRGGVYTWVVIFYERNMNKHKVAGIVTMIR